MRTDSERQSRKPHGCPKCGEDPTHWHGTYEVMPERVVWHHLCGYAVETRPMDADTPTAEDGHAK